MADRTTISAFCKPERVFLIFVRTFLVPIFLLLCMYQASASAASSSVPVIGILSQPVFNESYHYIAASYVKWLESAGAAAIVIPYDADEALTREIFSQINGALFPGGADKPISLSVRLIWDLAVESNQRGQFFPIWGTCLGFEFMVMLAGGEGSDTIGPGFNAENISMPLLFPTEEDETRTGGVFSTQSELYSTMTMRETLSTHNITMNYHRRGITPSQFMSNTNLTDIFHATSTNFDLDGRHFVSTIESIHFPFYGVQYHPEKNNFEYGLLQQQLLHQHRHGNKGEGESLGSPSSPLSFPIPFEAINHSEEAVDLSIHLSRFFVSQARKNTIGSYTLVEKHPLLYNYPVSVGTSFEQIYRIPPAMCSGENGDDNKIAVKSRIRIEHTNGHLRGSTLAHLPGVNEMEMQKS